MFDREQFKQAFGFTDEQVDGIFRLAEGDIEDEDSEQNNDAIDWSPYDESDFSGTEKVEEMMKQSKGEVEQEKEDNSE